MDLSPVPRARFVDNNGNALAGGKLFTYQAGTTIKLNTYTDFGGGTPNTDPVILDARGECDLWLPPGTLYKFVLSPSTDTDPPTSPIWTRDNIQVDSLLSSSNNWLGSQVFNGEVEFFSTVFFAGGFLTQVIGDWTNAVPAARVAFQTSVTNGQTSIPVIPNGVGVAADHTYMDSSAAANCSILLVGTDNGAAFLSANHVGTGPDLPLKLLTGVNYISFNPNNVEAGRFSSPNAQLLIGTTAESAVANVLFRNAKRMQLDDTCFMRATGNAVNQAIANTTFTQLTFNTVSFDQAGALSGAGNVNWTPPAGYYNISAAASMIVAVDGTRFQIMIYKNGVAFATGNVGHESGAGQPLNCTVNIIDKANGTDVYSVYAWQNTGGGTQISGLASDTYFQGYRIG